MMSLITVLIPLIASVGKWLIDRDMMSIEAKKNFLAWVRQSAKDGAISVRLRASYEEQIKKHLEADNVGSNTN
jgi:hypothetical protein